MKKLHLATIIFEDEQGNKYPVDIIESSVGSSFAVNISCDPQIAAQLMAGCLVGGGFDAIERMFVKKEK